MEPDRQALKLLRNRRKMNRHLPLSHYFSQEPECYFLLSDAVGDVPVKVTTYDVDSGPEYDGDMTGKPSFVLEKYWSQRYALFSRFDEGVLMDEESWYSVTHESVARVIADTCADQRYILDAFAGVGGNAIQFAAHSHVLATEIDNKKANYLRRNAKVYGVHNKIRVIRGDFFEVAPTLGYVDLVFLSPPWGGPTYQDSETFSMMTMVNPDMHSILHACAAITKSVFLYMPRNIDPEEVLQLLECLPEFPRKVEIQLFFFGNKLKTVGILIGEAVVLDPLCVAEAAVAQGTQSRLIESLNEEFCGDQLMVQTALVNVIEASGADNALSK